jgi:hypothetical protein
MTTHISPMETDKEENKKVGDRGITRKGGELRTEIK